jgi:hypothetical protein
VTIELSQLNSQFPVRTARRNPVEPDLQASEMSLKLLFGSVKESAR